MCVHLSIPAARHHSARTLDSLLSSPVYHRIPGFQQARHRADPPRAGLPVKSLVSMQITKSYKYRRSKKATPPPLLPGDAAILRQLETERTEKQKRSDSPRLENLGPSPLEWQVSQETGQLTKLNLPQLMEKINERMWVELPDSGVHFKTAIDVRNVRRNLPPLVMSTQLYGVFPSSTTFLDRQINMGRKNGLLRLLTINVAGANDLIMNAAAYFDTIGNDELDKKFKVLVKSQPESTWLSRSDLEGAGILEKLSTLVSRGYLSFDPGNPGMYTITTPMQGSFVKLVLAGRKWLIKILSSNKWKELPESIIDERLHGSANYWKDLKGIQLEWILYDAVGAGYIEAFKTPIGRGWKLIRTK